jgi:dihydroneopterin triphosphate aldolase (PTPS-III) / 6-pyruvoyltetrahydropterin synthase
VKGHFSIHVARENLQFSSAHFIAYPGFREPLHGHNYQIGVRVEGRLSDTGYVLDFGLIKHLAKEIANRLDERTIIPALSDCLKIKKSGVQLLVQYENDSFAFPLADVALLPIKHSSAEELAQFVWNELRSALDVCNALAGILSIEISVAEGPGQAAIFRQAIEDATA